MYNLNMGELIQYNQFVPNNNVQVPNNFIAYDVPGVSMNCMNQLDISVITVKGHRTYRFSPNLIYLEVRAFTNATGNDKIGDDIVVFTFNGSSIAIRRSRIRGEYLVDALPSIGVFFYLDASKTRRAEALNQMVNRTIQLHGLTRIEDSDSWNRLLAKCEAQK